MQLPLVSLTSGSKSSSSSTSTASSQTKETNNYSHLFPNSADSTETMTSALVYLAQVIGAVSSKNTPIPNGPEADIYITGLGLNTIITKNTSWLSSKTEYSCEKNQKNKMALIN